MAHTKTPSTFQNPVIRWVDDRLPVFWLTRSCTGPSLTCYRPVSIFQVLPVSAD